MSKSLIFLLGRSGAGKTTTLDMLIETKGFSPLVSYTTRKKRENEKEGYDYFFISVKEFNAMNFKAKFVVNSKWKYGVSFDYENIQDNLVFQAISLNYLKSVAEEAISAGYEVKIVFLDIDKEERIKRLRERGETEESISKRIEIEKNEGDYDLSIFKDHNLQKINTSKMSVKEVVDKIVGG